jgi:hypothetical protein
MAVYGGARPEPRSMRQSGFGPAGDSFPWHPICMAGVLLGLDVPEREKAEVLAGFAVRTIS